jgi:hypothetical protein
MRFLDTHKLAVGLVPGADLAYGTPSNDYVNMGKFREAVLLLPVKSVGGAITVVVKNASAADGTGAAAIAGRYRKLNRAGSPIDTMGDYVEFTSAGFSIAANSDGIFAVEVRAEDLTDGKPFVTATLTQGTAGAVPGCGIWVMGDGHYAGKSMQSAIS